MKNNEFILRYELKGYDARMQLTNDNKFKLLKGSRIMKDINSTWLSKGYIDRINAIKEDSDISVKDGEYHYILQIDIVNDTPTFLSDLVTGTSGNGWERFGNEHRQTLDEVVRKNK